MEVDAEKLVFLIEPRSAIYNYKDKDHSNKIIIDNLWEEVAKEMNSTVSHCKTNWTNLRNCYSRHLLEEKNRPSGSSGKQKRKWYLADGMSFLKEFVQQHRNAVSSVDSVDVVSEMNEIVDTSAPSSEDTSTATNSPVPFKRSKIFFSDLVSGPLIDYLQSHKKEKPDDDTDWYFFKALHKDYVKLSGSRQRSYKMGMLSEMNHMLEEQEIEQLNATIMPMAGTSTPVSVRYTPDANYTQS